MFSFCVTILFLSVMFGVESQSPCFTPEGISGECTSVYNCPNVLAQFEGPLSWETTNYLRSLQCSDGVGRYPHVCCVVYNRPRQRLRPKNNSGQRGTWLNQISRSRGGGNGHILPAAGSCGLTSLSQRIYGGEETQLDDHPWMALLEYHKPSGAQRKLSCGGSLINTRYVMTAAHCLIGEIETRVGPLVGVRLGEFDTTKEIDCIGDQCADPVLLMGIEQKIPHERYDERQKNRENDIGLIRLNGEVTYTDYIKPICLPSTVNSPRSFANQQLVSAGWGRTLDKRQSPTKQAVNLPIVDQGSCAARYNTLGIFVSDNQLCAGGIYAQDTCDGDSGNPLMKVAGNYWIVEGIVSFGRGCGLEDWPAVYTRVANYEDWIRSQLRP